eukprot:m.102147 g.102147  ORF g.102147 m.102147 type:complete len:100 (+) comp10425_c0_seq2:648-947(+)
MAAYQQRVIMYSNRYCDSDHEYRHVILPAEVAAKVPRGRLLTETEWRDLGVQQSRGWVHYMLHQPEPHILLFKRRKPQHTPQEAADLAQAASAGPENPQ